MAGRSLTGRAAGLLMLLGLPGVAAQAADPDALVRRMAAQPFHYGGMIEGPVVGRVLIGLDAPAHDGAVHGEAMLLTTDRHLIDTGTVSGRVQGAPVPGGRDCRLDFRFAGRVTTLRGVCAASTLSGEITAGNNDRPGWLARQIFLRKSGGSGGRAWLTEAAFYD